MIAQAESTTVIKIPNELITINNQLMCTATFQHDMLLLTPNPQLGQGSIKHLSLQKGIVALHFDLVMDFDTQLNLNCNTKDLINFCYVMEGSVQHSFNNDDNLQTIDELHSAIAHSIPGTSSVIHLKAGEPVTLSLIIVDRSVIKGKNKQHNALANKLEELVLQVDQIEGQFYAGGYNIKIGEQLKYIISREHVRDLSEMFAQKGRYYLVLAKHMEQFFLAQEMNDNDSGLLKRELKKITQLGDYIKEKPEARHNINNFCMETGLSPAKLQQGFKFIYDRTVSDYVRHIRLQKAESLIVSTDLSISEVVYTVGLTSRSYFCKIFKRAYGCSPKEYKSKALLTQ